MADYLVFRLYGTLAAWGEVAVGEYRPSATHPGRSNLLGLLAAAVGVRRHEEQVHRHMAESYGFTVAVVSPGALLRDYHTAQVPPRQRGTVYRTRRDELAAPRVNTILSARDYRSDALCVVAVRARDDHAPFTLEALAAALRRPRFALYLGRKSCPPALPLEPQVIAAPAAGAALERAVFVAELPWSPAVAEAPALYWEEGEESGRGALKTVTRRDDPTSRRRRQFAERPEHCAAQE